MVLSGKYKDRDSVSGVFTSVLNYLKLLYSLSVSMVVSVDYIQVLQQVFLHPIDYICMIVSTLSKS